MTRTLTPELLDSLPPDHPEARHSRRDLRLINAAMGNHRWLVRNLRRRLPTGGRVLELGAGTGELLARLATAGIVADGLDRIPRPASLPAAHCWHAEDLRTFSGYARYDAVLANLILHHLSGPELADLGARLDTGPRLLLACEPRRSRLSQRLFALLAPLGGANAITRHDAHVSIAAGFRNDELPAALGLDPRRWTWRCSAGLFGASRLVAFRR